MMLKRLRDLNADPQRQPAAQQPPMLLPPPEPPFSRGNEAKDDSHRSKEASGCGEEERPEQYCNNYYNIDNDNDSDSDVGLWTSAYFDGNWDNSHCSKEATDCNEDSPEQYYNNCYDTDSNDGLWTPASFAGNCSDDEEVCRCIPPPKNPVRRNLKIPRETNTFSSNARDESSSITIGVEMRQPTAPRPARIPLPDKSKEGPGSPPTYIWGHAMSSGKYICARNCQGQWNYQQVSRVGRHLRQPRGHHRTQSQGTRQDLGQSKPLPHNSCNSHD